MMPVRNRLGFSRNLFVTCGFVSVAMFLLVDCGGCGSSGPAPSPDFSLSVSPSAISMTVGTVGPAVAITVVGQNGFAGTVNVTITGLPQGATSSPAAPLAISAFGTQQVKLFIPPTTPTGPLSIGLNAASGSLSHSAMLNVTVTPVSGTAVLQDASGQVAAGTIEVQGLGAGAFNPDFWQKNTLNWVPDVRMPMLAPQTTGPYQNIYAPSALKQTTGWRLFYGGWDGTDTGYDEIYSVTTDEFLSFANRENVIAHGAFGDVNNLNVQQLDDASLHMVCTALLYQDNTNKPVYFSTPDGVTWNGSPEPYSAGLTDIVSIQGYALFSSGNFNGANVLLRDNGAWVLYFTDWQNDPHTTYRATANTLPNFQLQGVALKTDHAVNDVKEFAINGTSWYLMGLHNNDQSLRFSLSNDGVSFASEQMLFNNLSAQDLYMVALGFVTRGK